MPRPKPIVLTVLDGWGYRAETKGNAIALAQKPTYDLLLREFPNTLVQTSGPAVGLPEGQMGNSEVGHMNLGAGRVVHMDITRIDVMIQSGEFFRQPLLLEAMARGRERRLHLLGLLSDGGVHSQLEHVIALVRMAAEQKVERLFIHAFTDGRDTPPTSGAGYLQQLEQKLRQYGVGASPQSSAAITPWTATTAGSGSSAPTARLSTAKATNPRTRSGSCARATNAA